MSMSSKMFSLWTLSVFLMFIGLCCGLSCNDCQSMNDDKCLDRKWQNTDAYYNDCGEKDTHCAKFKTVVYLQDSGFITGKERVVEVMSRMCIRQDKYKGRDMCTVQNIDDGFRFFCLCTTDNCNSGNLALPSILMMALGVIISLWFFKS